MNFLADESVDRQIVDRLRQDGHAVRYIAEMEPGVSDDIVLDLAYQEADLLVTADKDFAKVIKAEGFGVINPEKMSVEQVKAYLASLP